MLRTYYKHYHNGALVKRLTTYLNMDQAGFTTHTLSLNT